MLGRVDIARLRLCKSEIWGMGRANGVPPTLWIPAFAGMTGVDRGNDGVKKIGNNSAIIASLRPRAFAPLRQILSAGARCLTTPQSVGRQPVYDEVFVLGDAVVIVVAVDAVGCRDVSGRGDGVHAYIHDVQPSTVRVHDRHFVDVERL